MFKAETDYICAMKHGGIVLTFTLIGLAFCTITYAARSDSEGSPYAGIVARNVFNLKPPPPPPDPEANKPPPPKIFLTGITTILGNKRALMKLTPPAKPGEQVKEQSFVLGEGQREGELEVLEIDAKAGTVKVNEYGSIMLLDFENNGIKAAPAPGGPPAPGTPPGARGFGGNPGFPGGGGMAAPGLIPRPLRLPGAGQSVAPQSLGTAGQPALSVAGNTMALAGSSAGINSSATTQTAVPATTAEATALMLEANRLVHQDAIAAGLYPPLPRHPLSDGLVDSSAATTPTTTSPQVPTLPLSPGAARVYSPKTQ